MSLRREKWTPEEDAVLQQGTLAGQTPAEIAQTLGWTVSAVRKRAYTLRVPLRQMKTRR